MFKRIAPALAAAALVALGPQIAHAQKNYTDGGDLYSGSHTDKTTDQSPTKAGKFDPYAEGRKQSNKARLPGSGSTAEPKASSARSGKFDPYSEGAKSGKFDPYTEGAKKQGEPPQ
ncbi:hypothetical protein D9M69_199290 [compost metagenome]